LLDSISAWPDCTSDLSPTGYLGLEPFFLASSLSTSLSHSLYMILITLDSILGGFINGVTTVETYYGCGGLVAEKLVVVAADEPGLFLISI
jgi:hypothetical protein